MEKWKKLLLEDSVGADEIAKRFGLDREKLKNLEERLGMRVTRHYYSLIKEKNDPIYRQIIPDEREMEEHGLKKDPLAEDNDSPVRNIVHRYPDRCLFLVSPFCASYCRFCTRSRKVGDPGKISISFLEEGFEYIMKHTEIRDVIVSGGDPLMLDDNVVERILSNLRRIPHIEIIRLGTRMPCFLPQRVTAKLVKMLKKYHPLYINVHFNHPDELNGPALSALAKIADAGIPLGNQTVLLKGVNDDPIVMKELMHKLLKARVRPYYIYQADMVQGTEHLRTSLQKGLEIIEKLRGVDIGSRGSAFCDRCSRWRRKDPNIAGVCAENWRT
ncbi:MAG TPA: KamA family radical SAM protein [Victivallales bacterium]|nr:KamA family radical SAM protein [Victivallales bacterium]